MEHTREEDRDAIEVGISDAAAPHIKKHTAHHAAPPKWLMEWEDRRPRILVELLGEFVGVLIYTWLGAGATGAYINSVDEKVYNLGNVFSIGLAYGVGLMMALTLVGPVSGGHLNPGFTISFWLFKGFPLYKVPLYIVSQITGGFVGSLLAGGIYREQMTRIAKEYIAEGLEAKIYTQLGPAGQIASLPGLNSGAAGYVFMNEMIISTLLAIYVFSILDISNIFITFSIAPTLIGVGYMATIYTFFPVLPTLNAARDLGGRMACSSLWTQDSSKCWPSHLSAATALTSIAGCIVGGAIQTLLISDSARPIVHHLPDTTAPSARGPSMEGSRELRGVLTNTTTNEKI